MSDDLELLGEALPGYEIGGEIGRGGWGIVYDATHRRLGRRVAVKVLARHAGEDPTLREQFIEEARFVASLDHPHVVPVYDFVEHRGAFLIVMELLAGGTLWGRFHAQGIMSDEACAVTLAVCTALQMAHAQRRLHRDVKPENVLYGRAGVVKLSDFGVAKVLGLGSGRHTEVVGTPVYMAPEHATGAVIGPPADVYSTATMLFEMLSGRLPFPEADEAAAQIALHAKGGPARLDTVADVPAPIVEVVMRGLATAPEDRPGSAQAFGLQLARAASLSYGPRWLHHSGIELMSAGPITEAAVRDARAPDPRGASPQPPRPSTPVPTPRSSAGVSRRTRHSAVAVDARALTVGPDDSDDSDGSDGEHVAASGAAAPDDGHPSPLTVGRPVAGPVSVGDAEDLRPTTMEPEPAPGVTPAPPAPPPAPAPARAPIDAGAGAEAGTGSGGRAAPAAGGAPDGPERREPGDGPAAAGDGGATASTTGPNGPGPAGSVHDDAAATSGAGEATEPVGDVDDDDLAEPDVAPPPRPTTGPRPASPAPPGHPSIGAGARGGTWSPPPPGAPAAPGAPERLDRAERSPTRPVGLVIIAVVAALTVLVAVLLAIGALGGGGGVEPVGPEGAGDPAAEEDRADA